MPGDGKYYLHGDRAIRPTGVSPQKSYFASSWAACKQSLDDPGLMKPLSNHAHIVDKRYFRNGRNRNTLQSIL